MCFIDAFGNYGINIKSNIYIHIIMPTKKTGTALAMTSCGTARGPGCERSDNLTQHHILYKTTLEEYGKAITATSELAAGVARTSAEARVATIKEKLNDQLVAIENNINISKTDILGYNDTITVLADNIGVNNKWIF